MKIHAKTDAATRCSYCHDYQGQLVPCLSCGSAAHADCWEENGEECPSCRFEQPGAATPEQTWKSCFDFPYVETVQASSEPTAPESSGEDKALLGFLVGLVVGVVCTATAFAAAAL